MAIQVLSEVDLTMLDTTTDNGSTSAHGFMPKAPNDTSKVLLGDGTFGLPTKSATLVIPSPTSSEDITMLFTVNAITISKIVCVLVGSSSPSVTFDVRHGTDRSAAGTALITSPSATTNTTSGTTTTTFNNASVAAGSFVRVKTTAMSGTVTYAEITIFYS